jgi:hypothetical protein
MNLTGPKYDPNRNYGPHQAIGEGRQSDELWSTPLYQSFLALKKLGVSREDVDKIVLESMFGLSSGFTMRDLANKVVVTAKLLFPSGPHSGVFRENFERLNIVGDSSASGPGSGISVPETSKN